jgi:hypothetical protein
MDFVTFTAQQKPQRVSNIRLVIGNQHAMRM